MMYSGNPKTDLGSCQIFFDSGPIPGISKGWCTPKQMPLKHGILLVHSETSQVVHFKARGCTLKQISVHFKARNGALRNKK
jgi:hypothetical protein